MCARLDAYQSEYCHQPPSALGQSQWSVANIIFIGLPYSSFHYYSIFNYHYYYYYIYGVHQGVGLDEDEERCGAKISFAVISSMITFAMSYVRLTPLVNLIYFMCPHICDEMT